MPISKRTRFEVLRRDGYKCRYCGASAETEKLTVDHVLPVSLGGTDGLDNLAAACWSCNSGKSSTAPEQSVVEDVSDAELEAARKRKAAISYVQAVAPIDEKLEDYRKQVRHAYRAAIGGTMPTGWSRVVDTWARDDLPISLVRESFEISAGSDRVAPGSKLYYAAGIIRRKLAGAEEQSAAFVARKNREHVATCGELAGQALSAVVDGYSWSA